MTDLELNSYDDDITVITKQIQNLQRLLSHLYEERADRRQEKLIGQETEESKEFVRMVAERRVVEIRHREIEDLMHQKELELLRKPNVQIMCQKCFEPISVQSLLRFYSTDRIRCDDCNYY